ncbi:MAG: sensor histidine kinase [Actinomycetota bacterium]
MVATLTVISVLTLTLLHDTLVKRLDDDLEKNGQSISSFLVRQATNPTESSFSERYYGALLSRDGQISIDTNPSGDRPDLPAITPDEAAAVQGKGFFVPGTERDSDGWRVSLTPLQNRAGSVAIAVSYKEVNDTFNQVSVSTLLIGVSSTVAAIGIAWLAVTRSFQPLSRVDKTAAAIAAGDLSRRVEVVNPASEVGRLASSLNAMLAHIETAFASRTASEQRMRRFVQDASHELRTPLVTIRGFSELYRHGALQSPEDVGAAMGRIESEAKRMGQLVDDLLTLARVDEQRPLEAKPLDLLLLGNDAALDARASAPDRVITVVGLDGGAPRPAPILGDEARLRQVVANLVTNALRYTPEGSPLEIAVGVQPVIDDRLDSVLEIRDHGPGISEDEAARVFERFYRADTSRHRETGGTGLGLAIVAALVAQHDGTVRLTETPGGGATMSIRIPYHPQADEDEPFALG